MNLLPLGFPVFSVASYVEEIFVHIDVVTAHYLRCLADNLGGDAYFSCYFYGKRAAGVAHRELEKRLHVLTVVEHGAVNQSVGVVGIVFEVLIVSGDDAEHAFVVDLMQNGLSQGSTNLRLGAATELIDENERSVVGTIEHHLHIIEMRTVGAEVVFYRLLIADVDENASEHADVRIVVDRRQDATLRHILHHTHRF